MAEAVIEVEGFHQRFGTFEAVAGIDLCVARGEIFAFLGPNGAGKTTTVEVLEGFRAPTEGNVRVLGAAPMADAQGLRSRVGIVLQEAGHFADLTPAEVITAWARFYPRPRRVAEVLDLVGLTDRASVRARNLSGGEQRRLDLALGIVGRPEVLFLDEPTTGFDPAARRATWDVIEGLVEHGTTVFLTTHYLEEAQRLADRIMVIAAGRIVAEGTPDDLGGRDLAPGSLQFVLPGGLTLADLPIVADCAVELLDGTVVVTTHALTAATATMTGWAVARDLELVGLSVTRPSLEDTYLDIVAHRAELPTDAI